MPDAPAEMLRKAEAGDAEAQNELARSLIAVGDRAGAQNWFRRAAELGLPKAKHNLGVLALQDGDMPEACRWFGEAAKDGWPNSLCALGLLCEEAGQIDEALQLLGSAAQQGHEDAQDAMGRIHFERNTEQDDVIARQWSELAAAQGNAAAMTRLGTIYHEGRGTPRDPPRAAAYFREAASRGHPGAQLMIGVALHMGIGVDADPVQAKQWLTRSAEQGNPLAQAYLGAKAGMAGRRVAPARVLGLVLLTALLYAGAYVAFRQSHAETWDRDKRTYVIYPETYGRPLYYLWRPLSYLDTAITGMQHHIGPHR